MAAHAIVSRVFHHGFTRAFGYRYNGLASTTAWLFFAAIERGR
jgi:hypothetical protein